MPRFTSQLALFCFGSLSVAVAAEQSEQPSSIKLETLTVQVQNEDGQPVSGVRLVPWALGSNEGHGQWPEKLHGPAAEVMTGDDGIGKISYPKVHLHGAATTIVSIHAVHPEYCVETVHLNVPNAMEPNQPRPIVSVKVRHGTRLTIGVVEGDGSNLLADAHLQLSVGGVPGVTYFTRSDDNWYVSRPLPPESNWVRAVRLPDDGPAQFSTAVLWAADILETHEIALSVEPGVRVEGRLDESVPRPVRHGRVVVRASEPYTAPHVMSWMDVAEIAEDGTFLFPSLPRGSDLQMIAVCDGFVSQNPTVEELSAAEVRHGGQPGNANPLRCPQVFAAQENLIRPVIRMERTATCRVRVTDQQGRPVAGLSVSFWPNQHWIGMGNNVLGTGYRSTDLLRSGKYQPFGDREFQRITDDEGRVEFTNLPVGSHSFVVMNPDLSIRHKINGGQDEGSVTVNVAQPADVAVRLDRRPM